MANRMQPYRWHDEERPAWTQGHCDYAARRRMVKIFLQHLWIKWREAEGLPTNQPYVIGRTIDGHQHTQYRAPEDFPGKAVKAPRRKKDKPS